MSENEAPTRKPRSNGTTQLANEQIDRRLAEAIKERTKLHAQVSRMIYAQERLSRVEQEINSLVQLKRTLQGGEPYQAPPQGFVVPPYNGVPPYAGHAAEIPMNVGSIPAGPRQPKPTTANAGPELAKEGGFS